MMSQYFTSRLLRSTLAGVSGPSTKNATTTKAAQRGVSALVMTSTAIEAPRAPTADGLTFSGGSEASAIAAAHALMALAISRPLGFTTAAR